MRATSGPWSVTKDGYRVISGPAGGCRIVAVVAHNARERTERARAEARLIAAAPELLAALRDCVAALGGIHSDNVPASAGLAIAKAEGK